MLALACLLSAIILPPLPATDGAAHLQMQEAPQQPGQRMAPLAIYYPGGQRANVTAETGIFLTLHNWGGTGDDGTADPKFLANRYNVIAITVDYYQSGKWLPNESLPYDFGWLQALDALRALEYVQESLTALEIPYHTGRIYATGGSGGGNVALMANKLAPRAFACVVAMCAMPRLSDDIAYGLQGGSNLEANYSRDPQSPNYLAPWMQEIRDLGNPGHLVAMKAAGATAKIVVVHGAADPVCLTAEARNMVQNMEAAGLSVEAHWVSEKDLDGEIYTSTGHTLGDRTQIVAHVADAYLLPNSKKAVLRESDHATTTRYPVTGGFLTIQWRPEVLGQFTAE